MSASYTTNVGLGVPSLDDTDYVATVLATLTRLDASILGALCVREREIPSTSLVVSVASGVITLQDDTELAFAGGNKTLAASNTNYVYLDSSGTLQSNTTGFPSAAIVELAVVVTGLSTVTSIADRRFAPRLRNYSLSNSYLSLAGGTLTGLPTLSGVGTSAGAVFTATATPGSTVDGQVYYDSTAKSLVGNLAGVKQDIPGVQFKATASATVANTTTETTLVPTGVGATAIAANQLAAGKTVRVRAWGVLSTTGSPTATLQAKLGTLALSTGSISPGTGVTNVGVHLEAEFCCRTTGASGTVFGQGRVTINGVTTHMAATAAATLDTTGSLALALTMTWGTASASNTVTITHFTVEDLN